ncbi:MAG: 50S ribosomal protein L21 [Xanthobacteraceae bacterium]|jgi:large subunit ribosomal protein L21|nr:50S ribosomal protein L21 [Xanthobacteraceae bacterium]
MFAVIKTGGKQHRVVADQTLKVYLHDAKVGEIVTFPVTAHGGDQPKFGTPLVDGASVAAEVLAQTHGRTVIAFKKRRRQNSKRKRGYRDQHTLVRVTEILLNGAKPTKTARVKPEKKKAATAGEAVGEAAEAPAKKAAKPKAAAKKPAAKAKAPAKSAAKKKK